MYLCTLKKKKKVISLVLLTRQYLIESYPENQGKVATSVMKCVIFQAVQNLKQCNNFVINLRGVKEKFVFLNLTTTSNYSQTEIPQKIIK